MNNNNTVKSFSFIDTEVRTMFFDDSLWFVGKDVGSALGYGKPDMAVYNRVQNKDKRKVAVPSSAGSRRMVIINEHGLRDLILGSSINSWSTSTKKAVIRHFITQGQELQVQGSSGENSKKYSAAALPPEASNMGFKDFFPEAEAQIIDGQIWYAGSDIVSLLGYDKSSKPIYMKVADEDKKLLASKKGSRLGSNITFINESGIHNILVKSRLSNSKRILAEWQVSKRKVKTTGENQKENSIQQLTEQIIANPEFGIRLLTALQEERERNELQHKEKENR